MLILDILQMQIILLLITGFVTFCATAAIFQHTANSLAVLEHLPPCFSRLVFLIILLHVSVTFLFFYEALIDLFTE